MSKPRLCEILGVEVNERFRCKKFIEDMELEIDQDGFIHYFNDSITDTDVDEIIDMNYLGEMINHSNLIIRKPKWTQQDIDDAKAVKRLFTSYDRVTRLKNTVCYKGHINSVVLLHDTLEWQALELDNDNSFPSLKQGETVKLEDIINSEVEE